MPLQKIVVTIDEDGKIVAKTNGISGEVCITELQEIIGSDELFSSIKTTSEFDKKVTVKPKVAMKQGAKR